MISVQEFPSVVSDGLIEATVQRNIEVVESLNAFPSVVSDGLIEATWRAQTAWRAARVSVGSFRRPH